MEQSYRQRLTLIGIFVAAMLCPLTGQTSPQLAVDKGCYSCHGAYPRGEAPTFDKLANRLGRLKGNAADEKDFVEKYGKGKMFGHIDAHERISPESAALLIHWLVEGAK